MTTKNNWKYVYKYYLVKSLKKFWRAFFMKMIIEVPDRAWYYHHIVYCGHPVDVSLVKISDIISQCAETKIPTFSVEIK